MAYDKQAQEFVFSFYARGVSKERALPEIRKVYAGFSGSTWDEWEKKLDWKARRAEADRRSREVGQFCERSAETMLGELDVVRLRLLKQITEGGGDTQTVHAYTSVVKQMDALARRYLTQSDPKRVQMEVLSRAMEELFSRLRENPDLAKPLARHAEHIGELVTQISEQYGEGARA